MSDKLVYSLEITNGFVFRQIFELYTKLVIERIPIFLQKDNITIRTGTGSKNGMKLISNVEIITSDIIDYYFNEEMADVKGDEDCPAIILEQFNISNIGNNFKAIAKTNAVKLFKEKESKRVGIETIGLINDTSYIECAKYQSVEHDLSGFDTISDVPNIRININQFCSIMKGMTKGEPEYISFKVYQKGLEVESWSNSGSKMRNGSWGNIKSDKFFETRVNNSVIKAFIKINNMAPYGIIKVFSNKKGYLKLTHKIGEYGYHEIFLIDEKEED